MIRSACLALTLVASAMSVASAASPELTTVAERSGFQKTGRYEEVIALFFNREIAAQLEVLETGYMRGSERIELAAWRRRPFVEQLVQNLTRLVSPLL